MAVFLDQPFAVPAALLAAVSLPLALGLVPRNRWYGVRTRATLADDRVWQRANRIGGLAVLAASALYGLVAMGLPCRNCNAHFDTWCVHLAAFVLPLVAALIVTRYAVRANGGPPRER